ncbi:SLBB domain-containing protein [Rubritalea spongiae]|uniref:SLBB domain-containing protein n=1 Tax=Rubritalea spongiae TaxID=430797 RepID=A0ABW5E5Z6_9BACT
MKTLLLALFAASIASSAIAETNEKPSPVTVVIAGSVNSPGIYEIPSWSTLFEALAAAGGRSSIAVKYALIVREEADGTVKTIKVSTKDIHENLKSLPQLKHKDRIFIPESKI